MWVKWKPPRELVVAVSVFAVPSLVSVTVGPGTDNPCESLTVPSTVPVGTCANASIPTKPFNINPSRKILQPRWKFIRASPVLCRNNELQRLREAPEPLLHHHAPASLRQS